MQWHWIGDFRVYLLCIILIATVIIGFRFYLYSVRPTGQSVSQSVSVNSYPLKLELEMAKSSFALGERVTFKISMTNTSNESVNIQYPMRAYEVNDTGGTSLQRLGFIIFYENATELDRRTGGGPLMSWTLTLHPNETISQEFGWDQRLKLEGTYTGSLPPKVPAGTYMLKGAVPTNHDRISINDGDMIRIETPSINFTIG